MQLMSTLIKIPTPNKSPISSNTSSAIPLTNAISNPINTLIGKTYIGIKIPRPKYWITTNPCFTLVNNLNQLMDIASPISLNSGFSMLNSPSPSQIPEIVSFPSPVISASRQLSSFSTNHASIPRDSLRFNNLSAEQDISTPTPILRESDILLDQSLLMKSAENKQQEDFSNLQSQSAPPKNIFLHSNSKKDSSTFFRSSTLSRTLSNNQIDNQLSNTNQSTQTSEPSLKKT